MYWLQQRSVGNHLLLIIVTQGSMSLRPRSPAPEMVQPSGPALSGNLGRDSGKMTDSISEHDSNLKPDFPMGSNPLEGPKQMWLRLSVPYRPTIGLIHCFHVKAQGLATLEHLIPPTLANT